VTVIFLLIPLSVVIATAFLGAFIWAVRSGQYEDTYTPSLRLLWRDSEPKRGPEQPARPIQTNGTVPARDPHPVPTFDPTKFNP
jgi:cbb3-type cytochrome oxidase maturation protein